MTSMKKPDVSVSDMHITGLSLSNVELTFDISVDNPNPVAVTLASYGYDLKINQNSFVQGTQENNTKVQPSGSSVIQVPVRLGFHELYSTFTALKDKDETDYEFVGDVGVNVPVLGLVKVPIEKKGVFPVVKAPKISMGNMTVKNLSLSRADLELELNVSNPNAFGVILNSLNYEVDVNGLKPISGLNENMVEIAEKSEGTLTIPVSFSIMELGMTAYKALNNGESLNYKLNGSANVGATLPFFKNSTFNFEKSGMLNIVK